MRKALAVLAALAIVAALGTTMSANEKKEAPGPIVFEAKPGAVTFDHAKHLVAAKNDCKVCHDTLFKQAKGDLGYKAGMHKPAEAEKKACGACHVAGGAAFESKGNCNKCHVKK